MVNLRLFQTENIFVMSSADPSGTESVISLIDNETIFDKLEYKELTHSLAKTKINLNQAIYVMKNCRKHYKTKRRYNILRHMNIEYYENGKPKIKKIIQLFQTIEKSLKLKCFHEVINIMSTPSKTNDDNSDKKKISELEAENKQQKEEIERLNKELDDVKNKNDVIIDALKSKILLLEKEKENTSADPSPETKEPSKEDKAKKDKEEKDYSDYSYSYYYSDDNESEGSDKHKAADKHKKHEKQKESEKSDEKVKSKEEPKEPKQPVKQEEPNEPKETEKSEKSDKPEKSKEPEEVKEVEPRELQQEKSEKPDESDYSEESKEQEKSEESDEQIQENKPEQEEEEYSESEFNNLEALKLCSPNQNCFDDIYDIFERIAKKNDTEALEFGIRNQYHNVKDKYGNDILLQAATNDNFQLAKLLVEKGADYLHRCNYGSDAFHWFCRQGNLEAAQYFAGLPNVNPNSANMWDETALYVAAQNGQYEVCKFLLTLENIDANAASKSGETVLTIAETQEIQDLITKHLIEQQQSQFAK